MVQKNNLIGFGLASIIVHTTVIAVVLISVDDHQLPSISASNPQQRLQISMSSRSHPKATEKTLPLKPESRADVKTVGKSNSRAEKKPTKPEPLKNAPETVPVKPVASNTYQQQSQRKKSKIGLATTPVPDEIKSTTNPESTTDKQDINTRNAMIQERLNALISVHKKYPVFAIRRGWQGTVELGLRVEANGKLTQVRILKTSGYRILDEAALTMLTSADNVKGIELWLNGGYFDTTLPVEYRLTGG